MNYEQKHPASDWPCPLLLPWPRRPWPRTSPSFLSVAPTRTRKPWRTTRLSRKRPVNKITAGDYNGEMAKIKAMVDAKKVTWDVVEVESPELLRGCEEGLFEKIDWAKVGKKAGLREGGCFRMWRGHFRVVHRHGLQRRQAENRAAEPGPISGT